MRAASPRVPFLDLAACHGALRPELDEVWQRVVSTAGFIGGPDTEEFEAAWARYCGVAAAVGVANGTDAIELVLRALDIGMGHEVIIPANTFIPTAEAAMACGATPVFVDVDPHTLLVTAEHIAPVITPRTRAIIPVHLFGQPCQIDAINDLATSHGLAVIEDAAQAHGARWRGRRAGSLATAACFSFYPGKNLGAFGDGGAVVTDREDLAAAVRSLANHGRSDDHTDYARIGRNSRLDALQAGVLSVKLGHLDPWNERRRSARDRFVARLAGSAATPVAEHPSAESVWHLNVVQVPDRDDVLKRLGARGIDARVHYPQPCHLNKAFGSRPPLPVVEAAAARILSLPMHPMITDDQIDLTCDVLLSSLTDLGHRGPS